MRRNHKGNHHRGSFVAAACLASVALFGGLGSAVSRAAAAATTPADSELTLRRSTGPADAADCSDPSDRFNLTPCSHPFFNYAAPDTAPETVPPAKIDTKILGFHKGVWDLEVTGSHMAPVYRTRDHINAGSVGIGYFIADGFSLNAAVVGYSIDQPHDYGLGAGFDLYARLFLLTLDPVSIFVDGGAGAIFTDKAVPEFGTAFNFTPRFGVGLSLRIAENAYLVGGARYWHLSNAGYHSHERNPGFDSVQYYGGVVFTF